MSAGARRLGIGAAAVAALWAIPLAAFFVIRGRMLPEVRAEEDKSRKAASSRVSRDHQVRSVSPAATVAALGALPYILQSYDPDRSSGVLTNARGRAAAGLNFFFPWSWKPPQAFLMDLEGRVVWRWSLADYVKGRPHTWLESAALMPDGSVLLLLDDRGIVKVDRSSRVLWEAPLRAHHDLWIAPDGKIIALDRQIAPAPDIHPNVPVESDAVVYLSDRGAVLRRIPILDLLNRSGYGWLLPRLQNVDVPPQHRALDVFHTNHVEEFDGTLESRSRIYKKGNLLISIRNINVIAIVDPASEKIVWLWGPGNLTYQHHPQLLANGDILLFDNGATRSQVLEIDPLTDRIVWRYASDEFFSALAGGVQRLDNGDTLITESMKGYAFEVTPAGETVWKYANPEISPKGLRNGIIRMIRVDPSKLTFLGSTADAKSPFPPPG